MSIILIIKQINKMKIFNLTKIVKKRFNKKMKSILKKFHFFNLLLLKNIDLDYF